MTTETVPEIRPGRAEALTELVEDEDGGARALLLVADGAPAGAALLRFGYREDLDLGYLELVVDPDRRRRGHGRLLADAAAQCAISLGHTRLSADVLEGSAGDRFARRLGGVATLHDVRSTLLLETLDWTLVHSRAEPDPAYRLVQWDGACPDELVAAYARARESMNDRPLGTGAREPWRWDVGRVRRWEDRQERAGLRQLVTAAVHRATRAVAGYTELLVPADPHGVWQDDTTVVAAHRGRRLGLAVKSANLLHLRALEPAARVVLTWNAADNRYMRAVNEQLGFVVADTWVQLEAPLPLRA